mgnify:CR=1 FL=1
MRPKEVNISQVQVDNPDEELIFGAAKAMPGFDRSKDSLYLIGPNGIGKNQLAQELAQALSLNAIQAATATDLAPGSILALDQELIKNQQVKEKLGQSKFVYYLMGEVSFIAQRLGLDDDAIRTLAPQLIDLEPEFMSLARYIVRVQPDNEDESALQTVLESLSLTTS